MFKNKNKLQLRSKASWKLINRSTISASDLKVQNEPQELLQVSQYNRWSLN